VRWLELAVQALDEKSEAIEEAWVHIGLAKMLAHQGRVELARRHSEIGLAVADRILPDHLGAFGLDTAIQAGNLWSAGDPEAGRLLLARTADLAAATGDPVLAVLADASRSLVESDLVDSAVTLDRAEQVYPRARALDLDVAAWMVARAGTHAALAAGDADSGMAWSERVIELHLAEGGELGGAFVEMRPRRRPPGRGAALLRGAYPAQPRRARVALSPGDRPPAHSRPRGARSGGVREGLAGGHRPDAGRHRAGTHVLTERSRRRRLQPPPVSTVAAPATPPRHNHRGRGNFAS
jgi:hypothetical protein